MARYKILQGATVTTVKNAENQPELEICYLNKFDVVSSKVVRNPNTAALQQLK